MLLKRKFVNEIPVFSEYDLIQSLSKTSFKGTETILFAMRFIGECLAYSSIFDHEEIMFWLENYVIFFKKR